MVTTQAYTGTLVLLKANTCSIVVLILSSTLATTNVNGTTIVISLQMSAETSLNYASTYIYIIKIKSPTVETFYPLQKTFR